MSNQGCMFARAALDLICIVFKRKMTDEIDGKIVVGLVEDVTILGADDEQETVEARMDTGAINSSIDQRLAAKLKLGPIIKTRKVKQSNGAVSRPVIEVEVDLKGKRVRTEFTISNRSHMTYKALIGQNILKQGFLVDPSR